jgi:endonuclease/exonuclease/phosphatase family metal-dependent hydrolase
MKVTEVMSQMNLTDICRIFHPNIKKYTFFPASHRTFSKIDHILGHKANLGRYKKIEISPCILSDHHGLQLDFNNNRNNRKPANSWKLNNLLNNHCVKEEIKKKPKTF